MNTRVLDIIKNPELLQVEDLKLLEKEITKVPYAQSLRAIYLLGINQFQQENFQKELTKTAAYTTDKKILYYLINKKNREDFSLEKTEEIALQNKTPIVEKEENTSFEKQEISQETIQEENVQQNEKTSSNGIEFYLKNTLSNQETQISSESKSISEKPKYETKNSLIDFYVNPTKCNIEKEKSVVSPISFYENPITQQDKPKVLDSEKEESTKNNIVEVSKETNTDYEWQPMMIDNFSPSSKAQIIENKEEKNIIEEEKTEVIIENSTEKQEEIEEKFKQTIELQQKIEPQQEISNIPSFINTWKNWLNATPPPSNREKTFAIIDKFIENNPKMPPANEQVEFNFKEKDDDISHLMTETLAQLYLEQKLYSKAINAYQILQEKYPERTEEFEEAIEEIKKIRNK